MSGFAMVGSFSTLDEANTFFKDYEKVEEGLQFEMVSDTVELFQVWVQHTSDNQYVKMVIREITHEESESGGVYNEVTLEYIYSNDGSGSFSCGCD